MDLVTAFFHSRIWRSLSACSFHLRFPALVFRPVGCCRPAGPHRRRPETRHGDETVWAADLNHGGPALLIDLLLAHGQKILYIPGRIVHHASRLYRGEGKTDAKDAAVIADQERMRKDLQPLRAGG